MLFREIVAVYCENHTDTHIHCVVRMSSLHLKGNLLRLRYKAHTVNAALGKIRYLL
jgi:hypothetical protein